MVSQALSASEFGHSESPVLLFLREELVSLERSCKRTSLTFLQRVELAGLVGGQRELLVDFHCSRFFSAEEVGG